MNVKGQTFFGLKDANSSSSKSTSQHVEVSLRMLTSKRQFEAAFAIGVAMARVMISEYLPRLAKHIDKAAIVRSLSSTQGAHERGQYLIKTSYTQRGTIRHPALGAWLMNLTGQQSVSLPANVRIGNDSRHPGAGFMEAKYSPLPIGDPAAGLQNSKMMRGITSPEFDRRIKLSNEFDSDFRSKVQSKTGPFLCRRL